MRTNVLNDLSNVVKKGTGLAGSAAAAVDSCAAGSTTLAEYPGNHPVITQLSPRNHPLLDAIWKHVAMIFAVLMMSMANIGMAWGTTTQIFNMTTVSSHEDVNVARKGGTLDLTVAGGYLSSLTGGSVTLANYNTSSGTSKMMGTDSKRFQIYLGENTNAVILTLDNALAEGDVISFTSSKSNQISFGLNSTRVTTPGTTSNSYTIPAKSTLIGESTIYIWRSGGSGVYIETLTIAREDAGGGGGGCTSITPTWSTNYSSTTLNVGATSSTPVVGKGGSSGAVSFSSSDASIASVNSSTGVVTGVGAGTATITATVAADGGKCEGTVTKEFTIKAGVTYNANGADGGSVPTDASTYAYNANITVAGNTGSLYKTGFVFNGWNTRSDGTGTHYEAGATMKMPSKSAGVTLYAEWVGYATSWEWWNSGQSDGSKTFTYLTNKNYICSFKSSNDAAVASWDIAGTIVYRGVKMKTKDHYMYFWVPTGKRVSITFGYMSTKPTFTVGGVNKAGDLTTSTTDSATVTYTTTADTKFYIENETATKTAFTVKSVKIEDAATCPDAYSFHYGPAVGDWETPICFEQVGSTHEWNITNFAIPDHTNGQFWVGYAGSTNGQSATKAWTDSYSESAGVGNGAMLLFPTNGSVVGNAVGATGTLVIWDNSSSKNQYVGFKPDGYSIRYSASDHVFAETATANMWETDVVTLPDVSTTYTMEIKTADGYTTCYHSNAPEAISNMGVTNVAGGKKAIYLVPGSFNADGAKYAVYDVTNATFDTDFMTDDDGDGIYVGYVGSNCSSMILCRMSSDATTSTINWDKRWNQTANISISGDLAKKYTITNMTTWNECGYTTANMQPITGQKGKFRMWANSNDNNWYVHFIPYYVLSYDANGGSGTTAATERNSESSTLTVSVASNGFTAPTGYSFKGWATSDSRADAGTVDYDPSDSYTLTANATLYAVWTPILVSSITVSPASKALDVGGTQTLTATVAPATALDKAVTWSTSNGSIATVNASGVVTAVAPGSCTITATAHDGSGVTGTCSITVNKIQPTKYSFSVDKTTLCGGETATLTLEDSEDGVTYELRSDATHSIADTQKAGTGSALAWTGLGAGTYVVYAVADATYTERQMDGSKITISAGTTTSITTQPTNQEVTVGEEATLTVVAAGTSLCYQWKESATEDGTYSNVASSGTSASYSVTPAAAGTKWYKCVVTGTCGEVTTEARKIVANAAVTYRVTYDAQGGSVTPAYEDVTTATLPTPTKTDYTFQGWYTSGGTLISGTYNPTADITLHALWQQDACAGGGGGDPVSLKLFDGSTDAAFAASPISNSGVSVSYTSPDAPSSADVSSKTNNVGNSKNYSTGFQYSASQVKSEVNRNYLSFTVPSGYTATFTYAFAASGNDRVIRLGSSFVLDNVSSGYLATLVTFPSSNGSKIIEGGTYSSSLAAGTYYITGTGGGWQVVELIFTLTPTGGGGSGTCYYVTYNGNGADGGFTKDEASHASGSNVTVANNSFTKTGYTFTGWHTDPDGEDGTAYIAGGTISGISGNMTLYAQWEEEVACSTDPTVTEGSNSSVTSTTATVSCTGGISSLGTGGCTITSYGFVLGTSANPTLSNTVHEVGTTYTTTGTSFSKDLTGLTASTTYYVRPYATNGNGTAYGTQTSFTTTAAPTTYTVTFNSNGGSSVSPIEQASEGASVALANPTRAGFEFDGWYKTDGTKVSSPYTPTADITLYARWQEACDAEGVAKSTTDVVATGYTSYQEKGGSNVVFTSAPSLGFKYKDAAGNTINNSTTVVVRNNAYKCQISSDSGNKGSIKTNSTFSNVDSISFYFAASDKGGCKIAVWCSTDDFSTDSTQLLSATTYADNNSEFKLKTLAIPSGQKASALRFKFRFTVSSSGKTSYIDSLKIYSSTASSGTCYHVYYHGNGAESGFVSDTTSYADGAKATVLSYNDSRYPLTKDGYDFQGWATSAGGSAAYSNGQKITIDGADVHLYAKWATASSALVTWKMKTANDEAWATTTGTGTTDETNITSISTAHDEGDDKAKNSATAKTAMAEAEVSGTAAPNKSARFTFTIAGGKQVEINKFDCKVFNVASGSRTYKAQISDGAGNVYNSTNTVAVSAEATLTDASFVFGSTKILRGAVTIRVYAWGSGSEFRMGPDVKFYGTVEDYECATPAAPTISGVSEYVPGQTITLTASHDGENHDNLTTYTWYKGVDWATASVTTPVQAAATGAAGYTFTKASCAAGDAGKYWCEVANGTCNAHNSEGYNIIVYPTYTITYNLNEGDWGEVEHKTSYTQFDEDYTLPIPTKDGFVFAGWYEASDFSGLPTSLIETNSIGDKSFYAKWGSAVTATWTITKVDDKLYRGGGGYSVKAVIDQTAWNESYKDQLELTATEGVTLKNIVASVVSSHVQVTADFDITTGLAADATEITFTLDVPADGTYAPAELTHDEDLTSCAGSSTVWDFTTNDFLNGGTWSTSGGAENKAYATDGTTILKYYAGGSSDEWDSSNEQLKTQGATAFSTGTGKKQMTQKYFFFPTLSGKGTISVVYGTTSNDLKIYEATSNNIYGLEPIITLTSTSTTSTSYTFDGDKKYYMNMESNKVYFKRITFTASSGGITPTLSWTPALNTDADWDSGNNRLNKETGDVDFTFVAVQDKNSLGAITYSSSSPSVATVNAAGTVHIVGAAGDATITATLAASGCFEEATATYNIHVEDNCIDEPGTIAWTDLGCRGIQMTVSGHTALAGVSYQWYKVGTPDEAISGATEATYTATEAGEYYVVVTNTGTDHCPMASTNTVKVASKAAATATKIVDSWYVKNGRRTPDVALVQTTGATDFIVKNGETTIWNSDSTTTTGFGGCGFHMGTDGIIYLNGTKDNGDATTDLTAGDVTLKITANDGCGSSASELSITIHCQEATTYKEIAFVVDGEKGKGFDQVTSGHADGTELYEYLDTVGTAAGKSLFRLTEQNIYSTTDEKAIRQHYSQYDAILITDDPSTNKVPNKEDYKTGGYVNAFGTMIDVRPILTMEAYVSALKNWGSKGIKGNPQSPNPRQYEMRLECKDHEIYGTGLPDPEDGTNVWEEVIDGETFRHVILVDSTLGIYNGVAYNVETAGDKKPALQGFTGEAAGSLLGLGRILEGTLQAAIERQEEPAARLLVFGINAKALHETCALTNEGKTVIKNILIYLLKTNMEEVDDCSNYFTGKNSTSWSDPGNWSKESLPSPEAKVRILAPCVISGIQPHVLQVSIVNSGNSNIRNTARGSAVCNGTLTIQPDGALIADGKIRSAVAPHFAANDLMPTTPEMLTINTNGSGQAALIFNNEEGLTKATVNLHSLGRNDGSYKYQYFAIPMEYVSVSPAFANETHGGTKIYTYVYNEASSGWTRRGYYDDLYAFEGLGITTKSTVAMNYTMTGTLASTATKEITLTHDNAGLNLIGNSWMAPIQIGALAEDNTGLDNQTVYIYCAGRDPEEGAIVSSDDTETAGQWIAIPFSAAEFPTWKDAGKLSVIPAMQAFEIKVSAEATLTLDYDKVVRGSTNDLNAKLRAPRRRVAAKEVTMTNIRVSDSKTHTDLSLFEGERFSDEFDNGWEAEYMNGDGRSAKLYAETVDGKMAVVAMTDYEGTMVGFAPGQERVYIFSFMGADNGYYLNDIKMQQSVRISEGETYSFTYEDGDDASRFMISRTPFEKPGVATGTENIDASVPQARKILYNDKLYIIRGGHMYDATGKMVK